MKLVYLPLDSRPCNMRFPVQLSALRNVALTLPPMEWMDHFRSPAPSAPVLDWLGRETANADALALSVDHLCFGSLLASREDDVSEQAALERLEAVSRWKAANPRLRIHAYSVIMRSAISTLKAEDVAHHRAVTEYSQAFHRAQLDPSSENRLALERVAASIPEKLLAKYERVRGRNHQVNLACVRLASLGLIDRLLLLQEDSQPLGIHKMEQAALRQAIDQGRSPEAVFMHNGADEAGCLCCAALIALWQRAELCIKPVYLRGSGRFIAQYEDRPFEENLRSQCAFAGIRLTEGEDADCLLCMDTPPNGNQADHMRRAWQDRGDLETGAQRLADALKGDRPAGLLDLLYANGGDGALLTRCAHIADIRRLGAYAAWNTASNSLGTILAQLLCMRDAPRSMNMTFTLERLLDDYAYQGNVRRALDEEVRSGGEDPYCLSHPAHWEQRLAALMDAFVRQDPLLPHWSIQYSCSLPWPRTFEARFDVSAWEENR